MSTLTARRRSEAGTGIISTLVGFVVFLVFLLLAVQVVIDLFARSFVSSVAYDAARIVAGSDAGASGPSIALAEEDARRELGRDAARARFAWSVTADAVSVRITVPNRAVLPPALAGHLGLDTVTRGAVIQRERVR